MGKINVLSSKIYNRIAAGEVVDRPSSVVKELVENSIDAKSSSITIEIENGGVSLIRVADNGIGIEKDDLKKALLPHSTSKIAKVSDLDNICSLGFRGEALASIASVSKLRIRSKTAEQQIGAEIYSEGGQISTVEDCAIASGTEITVKNLFYNTPARAKFLKSDRSEESDITTLITRFILGNCEIAIKYVVNGKVVLQSFGDGIHSAFACVYGVNTVNDCFYIDTERHGIAIKGFIGKHYYTKSTRSYQTIFLNNRYIVNQTIASAIGNAYSAYLMKRQYPFYSLSITVPNEIVDVNVHPNKTDVRFANNQIIYGTIYSIISKVLDGSSEAVNIVSEKSKQITDEKFIENDTHNHNVDISPSKKSYAFDTLVFHDSGNTEEKKNTEERDVFAENKAFLEQLEKSKKDTSVKGFDIFSSKQILSQEKTKEVIQEKITIESKLNYVGQALNTYLIYQDSENLYLIDQHAAHERVLFDKLNKALEENQIISQPLLLPFVLNLNGSECSFITEKVPLLIEMGFEMSDFGQNSFKVDAVPSYLTNMNLQKFFDELLFDMDNLKAVTAKSLLKEKIAQKACKSAIKAGDVMSENETQSLLDFLKHNLGLKCPHGRPIAIKITKTEIEKWFKRIV